MANTRRNAGRTRNEERNQFMGANGLGNGGNTTRFENRRVCLVGDVEPPAGGVATYCRLLVKGLFERGWHVTFLDTNGAVGKRGPEGAERYVATTKRGNAWRAISRCAMGGVLEGGVPGSALSMRDRVVVAGLKEWFAEIFSISGPLVVHTSHAGLRSLAAIRAARELGIPVVVTIFGSEFTSPSLRRHLPVALYVCDNARVIAISRHTARMGRESGVTSAMAVVYPGIDPDEVARGVADTRFFQRYRLEADAFTVLYAGWLVKRKGPEVLLEAVGRLRASVANRLQVLFIGPDHGLEPVLRGRAADQRLEMVRVIGEVPPDDVYRFYRTADVLVFPTITQDEGFGLVAVEAAAAGCAVLGSRIGAIPEVVSHGENGALFTAGSAAELAALLEEAVQRSDLVAAWQRASPQVAARFHYRRTAAEVEQVYEDALAEKIVQLD